MAVIEFVGVRKSFRGQELYSGVGFEILDHETVALSGPNGSGKSVLLRLMCGFLSPDEGAIVIDSRFLSGKRTFPEKFGVIIDGPGYIAGLTGKENLQELARIRNTIGDSEIEKVMLSVGLDPALPQKVRQYSLGMKQKLALAQALMEAPEVLILDEPFNALDADAVDNLTTLLLDMKRQGTTMVFTSHDREHILALADRELVISNRRVTDNPISSGNANM